MSQTTQPILSTRRIRHLQLQAGLSERALARATAMTSMSITALEEGRNHDELSLRHLARIAAALGTHPAALFEPPEAPEPQPDDILLEAALATTASYVKRDQIARGLGWTLDRVTAALRTLQLRLGHTGQRIASQHGKIKLVAATGVLSDTQERDIEAAHMHERGLTLALAQVLRQAVDGRIDPRWQRAANANQLLAQGSLLKLGFAETRDGRLEPTADVLSDLPRHRHAGQRRRDRRRALPRARGRLRGAGQPLVSRQHRRNRADAHK
jgi:transcriptional regulator with XRE-family HTH domain